MRPGPAGQEPAERVACLAEEGGGRPRRRLGPGRVAVAGGVLHRDPAGLPADPHDHRPPGGGQRLQPLAGGRQPAARARRDLLLGEVAEPAQQVGDLVHRAGLALVDERLALELRLLEGRRVEQLAQLLLAEQLAEQVAVEGERLGPSLRERGVAVVHVGGDVVEEERGGERGRPRRLHPVDGHLAALDAAAGRRGAPAGRRRRRGTRGTSPRGSGSSRSGWRRRAGRRPAGAAARAACGCPGRRRGRSSARAAFSRNRAAKRAVPPTAATTWSSTASASGKRSSSTPSRSPSGRRIAIPSSDQMLATSAPSRSRRRASIAIAQGAWTRPPNGVRSTSRQSPSSSRKRSTTTRRSVGRAPAASRSSSR